MQRIMNGKHLTGSSHLTNGLRTAPDARRGVRAELLGGHSHGTLTGGSIRVWRRAGKYVARGGIHGRDFGGTLGGDPALAAAKLPGVLA
jgi:hypothetical protein